MKPLKRPFLYCALLIGGFMVLEGKSRADEMELRRELSRFYDNSVLVMNLIPPKKDEHGKVVFDHLEVHAGSPFSPLFVPAPNQPNDRVEDLVEVPRIYRTLKEMEDRRLLSQELQRHPWSDSYWPLNRGMTADRYADTGFPSSTDWTKNFEYVSANPATSLLAEDRGDLLAPSEKYDYLMGDDSFTLTQRSWDFVKALGTVETWAGICDGWSAASIFYDEPLHAIPVTGIDGRHLQFFPSDVNALSSLLWAKGHYPVGFIGSRCGVANPPRDPVGRIIAPECFDSNPGTWHMAVVNQIGQAQRPLIINATYDYEIWNYPVWKYAYSYFNPQTLQPSSNWRDAVISYDRYAIDKFKKYRSRDTRYVVGISMDITYMIENVPTHLVGPHASPRTVHYIYDLELDSGMTIIGGEWYTNIHPDFIWAPKVGARSISTEDPALGDPAQWTGLSPPPNSWSDSARIASHLLQPLAAVVDRLVQLSHDGP